MSVIVLPYQGGPWDSLFDTVVSVSGDDGGDVGWWWWWWFTLAGPVARTILLEPTAGDFREREGVDVQG